MNPTGAIVPLDLFDSPSFLSLSTGARLAYIASTVWTIRYTEEATWLPSVAVPRILEMAGIAEPDRAAVIAQLVGEGLWTPSAVGYDILLLVRFSWEDV